MLTPREVALSEANRALSLGRGRVLGAAPGEIAAERLQVVRRAQRAVRAAIGTPRIMLREVDDDALTDALTRIDEQAQQFEADLSRGTAGERSP